VVVVNWTVRKDIPHYGLKEHASVDTRYGFVLATEITPASHHDSPYLPLCVAGSCHTKKPIKKVFADKGYFGKNNRDFLHMNGIEDGIMRKSGTRPSRKSVILWSNILAFLIFTTMPFGPGSRD